MCEVRGGAGIRGTKWKWELKGVTEERRGSEHGMGRGKGKSMCELEVGSKSGK
jgi:hypothetical protein